jgi:hypothetical protein
MQVAQVRNAGKALQDAKIPIRVKEVKASIILDQPFLSKG